MMTQKALALSALLLGLSACGKWTQDPFSGKDKRFRDTVPTATKPDFTKPLPSDAVRVLSPKFASFEEGNPTEFQILGKVYIEGYKVDLVFENLGDFPGAKYDAKTGKFTWTPPRGFVDAAKGGDVAIERTLTIAATATKPDSQVLIGRSSINMRISRDFMVPEITNIQKTEPFVREGTSTWVQVFVRDRDANPNDVTTYPRIIFQSIAGTKSMASMLSPQRTDNLGNGDYRIYLQLTTADLELTSGIDNYKVGFLVASRYGKMSTVRIFDMDVYTSITQPTTTWTEELVGVAGTQSVHKFLIIDPKQESVLKVTNTFGIPVGASLNCVNANPSTLNCAYTWTPAAGTEGTAADIQVYVGSRNRDARDPINPTKQLTFRTRVQPKGP